jgi:hypothetical protein
MSDYREGLYMLPEHMREAVAWWIGQGEPHPSQLGGFLRAVLTNDLMGAFAHADFENRHAMYQWSVFLWNDAPSGCHGSEDNLLAWYAAHHPDEAPPPPPSPASPSSGKVDVAVWRLEQVRAGEEEPPDPERR